MEYICIANTDYSQSKLPPKMSKTRHLRYRPSVIYRGSLLGIVLFIGLLLLDPSPWNKTQFIADFAHFVQDVSTLHNTYTIEDWEKSDRKFKRYTRKYYQVFANQFTDAEMKTVRRYKLLYLRYRTKSHIDRIQQKLEDLLLNSTN